MREYARQEKRWVTVAGMISTRRPPFRTSGNSPSSPPARRQSPQLERGANHRPALSFTALFLGAFAAGLFNTIGRRASSESRTKRHVWTTPSKQERSGMLRRGRVRSCVRPTLRDLRTAGPDAIRSLAPQQIYALEWRITLDGFFQAPGSTGSPSRHHRPHHPVSCGNR